MLGVQHEFLDYEEADVHFVFSFEWNAKDEEFPYEIFTKPMMVQKGEAPAWVNPLIHERLIDPPAGKTTGNKSKVDEKRQSFFSSYQPTFAVNRRTLEYTNDLSKFKTRAYLFIPFVSEADLLPNDWGNRIDAISNNENLKVFRDDKGESAIVEIALIWTVRLFDTGSGTITVTARCPELKELDERADRYEVIHWLLHLASNVDRHAEAHSSIDSDIEDIANPADAFLWVVDPNEGLKDLIKNNVKGTDGRSVSITRLHDFARAQVDLAVGDNSVTGTLPSVSVGDDFIAVRGVGQNPPDKDFKKIALKVSNKFLVKGKEFLLFEDDKKNEELGENCKANYPYGAQRWDEYQSPFIVTSAVISAASMKELEACVSDGRAKEVGAILVKLTLHNQKIKNEFIRLNSDYIHHYLPVESSGRLRNMCLDERVFFSISRRGAISLTSPQDDGPASFVVPALLNLCEILRTQLHAATSLNWHLVQLARRASESNVEDALSIYEDYTYLRKKLLTNLQNPVTHLFDGGSVTEVAVAAQESLLIKAAWEQVERSFAAMDDLIRGLGAIRLGNIRK